MADVEARLAAANRALEKPAQELAAAEEVCKEARGEVTDAAAAVTIAEAGEAASKEAHEAAVADLTKCKADLGPVLAQLKSKMGDAAADAQKTR